MAPIKTIGELKNRIDNYVRDRIFKNEKQMASRSEFGKV